MAFTIQVQLDAVTMTAVKSISASLATLAANSINQQLTLMGTEAALAAIATALEPPPPPVAVAIRLALPTIVKKGILMSNYQLLNDAVVTIPILVDDAAGDPVPPPPGDTFTVVSSIPASLAASISGSSVVINALVAGHLNPDAPAAPDLFITVSDSAGLTTFVQGVDIVADTAPKALTLDLAHATSTTQAVPTNPGP